MMREAHERADVVEFDPRKPELEAAVGPGRRMLGVTEWERARFEMLEMVRSDVTLKLFPMVLLHALAFDYTQRKTLRCTPSFRQLGAQFDKSDDTVRRAVRDLVEGEWIVHVPGEHRGSSSSFGFLVSTRLVRVWRGRQLPVYGPERGADMLAFSGPKGGHPCNPEAGERGANLRRKGGKTAAPYNKDKPWKNHGARAGARAPSDNPMVIAAAARAVAAFREGRMQAIADEQPWVRDHIIAADLLTPDERAAAGLS
ncbi:hypothetical protein [Pseudooceanicola nanhaiensis]|uniref:hypothetical protein n=1 Tax=Pseudooceanicola nanhaiensis TaxID=375761 RepID=UPI001CD52472|nr:hypothetical protein [Pseudooceanicola nanhaiensis]MCA0919696.1 hypothetical protein [Pseudooceanicola nanhaiensis]